MTLQGGRRMSALEQQLAQAEAQLTASASTAAPPQLAALVDDWFTALGRGDGSVLDLYVDEGYHLYGDERYEYEEIPGHLEGGGVDHEWVTDPLLVAEDPDGRYVVVRGLRNSAEVWVNTSAFLFEIVTTPSGELRLVQTAWFYDSEW
jgi:hypothetical protein